MSTVSSVRLLSETLNAAADIRRGLLFHNLLLFTYILHFFHPFVIHRASIEVDSVNNGSNTNEIGF